MAPDDRMTNDAAVDAIVAGTSPDPFAVLGRHRVVVDGVAALVFRTLQPAAAEVQLVTYDRMFGMQRKRREGLFEATVRLDARTPEDVAYRFRVREGTVTRDVIDPYQFGQVLNDVDLHLFAEGTQYRAWERFGAHRMTIGTVAGVHFAVWAPNAQRVSVIGNFNQWDGRAHVMRRLVPSGVWELFVPALADGDTYKFEVRTHAGELLHKADPYARRFEAPPETASVIWSDGEYLWRDEDWMSDRASQGGWRERPMSVYEVHPGSWQRVPEEGDRCQTYRELADTLVPYVKELGFTHIELMPIMEHPFSGSWGVPGGRLLRADEPVRHAGRLPLLR